MSTTAATCLAKKRSSDLWHSRAELCGKLLRTEDQRNAQRCGLHLAAERRRHQNQVTRDEEQSTTDADPAGPAARSANEDGFDQAALEWAYKQAGGVFRRQVAHMRLCKRCAKQAERAS